MGFMLLQTSARAMPMGYGIALSGGVWSATRSRMSRTFVHSPGHPEEPVHGGLIRPDPHCELMTVPRRWLVPLIVLATAFVLGQGMATASTATVSPGGNVTGTAGAVQWILSTQARTVNCTSSSFTATLASGTGALPFAIATDLRLAFSGCVVTGGLVYIVSCTPAASLNVTGVSITGITPVQITGIACRFSLSATCALDILGSVGGQYTNPATAELRVFGTAATERLGAVRSAGSTCSALVPEPVVILRGASSVPFNFAVVPRTTIDVV
jgi:hypothetical protein